MRKHVRLAFVIFSLLLFRMCQSIGWKLIYYSRAQNNEVYQAVKTGQYQKAEEALPEEVAGTFLITSKKGEVSA